MLALGVLPLWAQSNTEVESAANDSTPILVLPTVSLDTLLDKALDEDAILLGLVAQQGQELHANDTAWEQYPHPLCIPLMYVPPTFRALMDTTEDDLYSIDNIRANARRYITQHHSDMYVSISDPKRMKKLQMGHMQVQRAMIKDIEEDLLDKKRALRDQKTNWRRQLNLSLQITQNYATNNWYQGAANAFAMLAGVKGYANYKDEHIVWENSGEWRAGLSTVSGDSLRVIKVTDDVFRLNTKFGFQVHAKWYISAVGEFKTNFWPNYRTNSSQLSTTFLTPIRFNLGVGVDYKPIKGLSVNISPATYKMVYATISDAERVNVSDFGIEAGKNILNELGSSLRVDWKWRPLREIEMEANFYFFTNYQRVETELELDVNFIINRYLSAKLMMHPRYDSTIELAEGQKNKLQFKELISVGFSHTFR